MSISIFGSDYNFIRTSLESTDGKEVCSQVKFTKTYASKVHDFRRVNLSKEKNSSSALEPFIDFYNSIYLNKIPLKKSTGIMPPGVLYLSNEYVMFERPPCYQNISLIPRVMDDISYHRDEEILYRLPIPWQVYFVKYVSVETESGIDLYTSDVRMMFTSGPISSFEDNVYITPLTNFYTNGDLCRPMYSKMDDVERYSKDVAGVIHSAYDWVWNSGTNFDLTSCVVQYYMQMPDQKDFSIFGKAENETELYQHKRKFNFGSYYCSLPEISYLYSLWEKFSLEEVIELKWANPLDFKTFNGYIDNVQSNNLYRYLQEHAVDVDHEYWHYDSASEEPYQCGELECSCMGGSDYDMLEFLRWSGAWPVPESTVSKSFLSFIVDTTGKSIDSNAHLSSTEFYNHMYSSMRDIMLFT